MAKETKYSLRDFKKDFPTEKACLTFLFDTLHSRACSCGGEYRHVTGRKQFQCSKCRFQIAPASGTIFHKSDTPMSLWFHAIWVFSNAKSGISAKEMERQLGVTYKCAWRILSLIRKALKQKDNPLSGEVEIDTGYIGGRHYGGKNNEGLGRVMKMKSVITVAAQRGGDIRALVMPDSTGLSMWKFIHGNIKRGSTLLTDRAGGYKSFKDTYDVQSVEHGKKEYVRDGVHVNRIETFFSHLKRSIKGTFKSISKQHLQAYLDSFAWHYNNRHNDRLRFVSLLDSVLHVAR